MPISHRHKRYAVGLSLTLALTVVISLLASVVVKHGRDWFPMQVSWFLFAVIAVGVILACIPWWRALDEMQRRAHLVSWYWGGSFGTLVALLVAIAMARNPYNPLVEGAFLVAVLQAVSYAVFWVAFRLLHRSAQA